MKDPNICTKVLPKVPQLCFTAGKGDSDSGESLHPLWAPQSWVLHLNLSISTWKKGSTCQKTPLLLQNKAWVHDKWAWRHLSSSCTCFNPTGQLCSGKALTTKINSHKKTQRRSQGKKKVLFCLVGSIFFFFFFQTTVSAGSYFSMEVFLPWKGNVVWGRQQHSVTVWVCRIRACPCKCVNLMLSAKLAVSWQTPRAAFKAPTVNPLTCQPER